MGRLHGENLCDFRDKGKLMGSVGELLFYIEHV